VLIEQRKLPHTFELTRTANYRQTARAITNMTVRVSSKVCGSLRCSMSTTSLVRAEKETVR
jgi:methylthioribose-1-phosphate isomerase